MLEKPSRSFMIRNMPLDLYKKLQKSATYHLRSMNQEAIVALTNTLSEGHSVAEPKPFKWKKKLTASLIKKSIKAWRE